MGPSSILGMVQRCVSKTFSDLPAVFRRIVAGDTDEGFKPKRTLQENDFEIHLRRVSNGCAKQP